MTTIRPPRLDRTLTAVVFGPVIIGTGVTLASVAFLPGASVRVFVFILGVAFIAGGTWATARLRRVTVHLCDDTLRYSGFLSSWTAPRAGSPRCSTTRSSSGATITGPNTDGRSGC